MSTHSSPSIRGLRVRNARDSIPILFAALLAGCSESVTGPPSPSRSAQSPYGRSSLAPARDGNVALFWNEALLDAIPESRFGPPVAARAMAMVHTAMFDAWAAYDDHAVGTRLGGALRVPPGVHRREDRDAAISHAAFSALVDIFPAQKPRFEARMTALGLDPTDTSTDPSTPAGIGKLAAAAVLEYRQADGANQLGDLRPSGQPYSDYTGYAPRNDWDRLSDPNAWQPLRVPDGAGGFAVQSFLTPHWNRVTPFALASADEYRAPPPALFPHGSYRAQTEELIHLSAQLTDREKVITEYWADGPGGVLAPGHWLVFGRFVSQRDAHTLDQDIQMFFLLANAVFDAGIAAWDSKIHYDYVRPINAIRFLKTGKRIRSWAGPGMGTRVMDGADWRPYQPASSPSPPFAEYVSGHSTFGAAGGEILRRFTGSDYFGMSVTIANGPQGTESGMPQQPVTLAWQTFSDAVDENGMSRRYGGMHFRDGDLEGRRMGRSVGAAVWSKGLEYIDGTAPVPADIVAMRAAGTTRLSRTQ